MCLRTHCLNHCVVCRTGVFEDDDITHIEGDINPLRDMEIIFDELRLKDLEYVRRKVESLEKLVLRGTDKALKAEFVRNRFRKSQPVENICYSAGQVVEIISE